MENTKDTQIIIVMDEIDAINFRKKGFEEPGCKVISYNSEFLDVENPLVVQLKKDDLLWNNNVLVRSPYSSVYYCLEEASEKIHADYFHQYATILGALGAKYVSVKECSTDDSSSMLSGDGAVGVGGLGGELSVNMSKNKHQKALLELKRTFEPYLNLDKAKNLMRDFGLQNDLNLNETIKAIECGVKEKSRNFTLSLSRKLKSVFEFAGKIKPYGGIDIGWKIKNNKEIAETYSLHIEVEFDSTLVG